MNNTKYQLRVVDSKTGYDVLYKKYNSMGAVYAAKARADRKHGACLTASVQQVVNGVYGKPEPVSA